jgi:RNA polymerase sigma factor (sigma-70 family)
MKPVDFIKKEDVKEALLSIPERDRFVLNSRFNDLKTLREVGSELGISPSRVKQIESKAFWRLREVINKYWEYRL